MEQHEFDVSSPQPCEIKVTMGDGEKITAFRIPLREVYDTPQEC